MYLFARKAGFKLSLMLPKAEKNDSQSLPHSEDYSLLI